MTNLSANQARTLRSLTCGGVTVSNSGMRLASREPITLDALRTI